MELTDEYSVLQSKTDIGNCRLLWVSCYSPQSTFWQNAHVISFQLFLELRIIPGNKWHIRSINSLINIAENYISTKYISYCYRTREWEHQSLYVWILMGFTSIGWIKIMKWICWISQLFAIRGRVDMLKYQRWVFY